MNSALSLLRAVAQVEQVLAGARADIDVDWTIRTVALRFRVERTDLALAVLTKLVACDRARADLANDQGDGA